jgi:hypothetical protein
MLITGTMQAFLRITKDYAVSPDDRAFLLHGTKAHANLDKSDDEYSLLEEVFNDDTTDVTGIADVIESENGITTLIDYKTSGSFKVMKAIGFYMDEEILDEVYKSGERKGQHKTQKVLKRSEEKKDIREWQLQLNKYRIEMERRSFHIDKLKIQCVVRDGGTYIARSRGVFKNLYYFDIPILPDDEVIKYFIYKRIMLSQALERGKCDLPCDTDENWEGLKCERYCEVAEWCSLGRYLKQEKEKEIMPIKGLSETRRLPRLGKIRLGIKMKNDAGKEYPKEVDYFILDPQVPDPAKKDEIIAKFHELYGEQPKRITIMLPVPDSDIFFQVWYRRYGKTTLLQCKGDGQVAICSMPEYAENLEVTGRDDMGMTIVKCNGKACPYYVDKKCVEAGTLNVFLPELEGLGVWQINTGSINSIMNIYSSLDLIKAACGRIHMIPLTLERRKEEIAHEGKKTSHYILNISTSIKLADLQRQAMIDPTKILLELGPAHIEGDEIYDNAETVPFEVIPDSPEEPETKPEPKTKPEPEQPQEQPESLTISQEQVGALRALMTTKGYTFNKVVMAVKRNIGQLSELTKEEYAKITADWS